MPTPPRPAPSNPKKILVLGATSGIAEATCRVWATEGASLFLVGRNPEKLAAVATDLRTRGASYVDTAVADLDDATKHPELLAHAINSLTGMDIAFLAHGVLGDQPAPSRTSTKPPRSSSPTSSPPSRSSPGSPTTASSATPAPSPSSPPSPATAAASPTTSTAPPKPASPPSSAASATASTAKASPSSTFAPAPSRPP